MAPTRRRKANFELKVHDTDISSEDFMTSTPDTLLSPRDISMASPVDHTNHGTLDCTQPTHQRLIRSTHGADCYPQRLQHGRNTRATGGVTNGMRSKSCLSLLLTVLLVVLLAVPDCSSAQYRCPRPCRCRSRGFVDCGFRSLNRVPRGIPRYVQRL
ncbi:matrix-remodeling-associated protein 5 [Elysia marginata]|uniref:Matrix-remodeling-associated protein 5 n=1 Tax=Elysia marginata TaxID=1093978 RepID=A0AAV4HDC3_9GAST|nr:matrix-remodeling-associated protein 5 [Elysia marginata]